MMILKKRYGIAFSAFVSFLVSFLFSGFVIAAQEISTVNLRPGVTEVSRSIYDLHLLVFWICVAISVVVYGVMVWSLLMYRRSKGAQAASFSHSTVMEIIWTTIPAILLVVMLVPSVRVIADMYDLEDTKLDILITGYQWKWKYDYLDQDISFFSNLATSQEAIYQGGEKGENYLLEVDNELVIPVDTKVRFLVTANDVLHSWWVPDFAIKRDAIPGYVNEAWATVEEPGVYRGQCAELCGKDHAFMPIVVRALPQAEYDQWVASKTAAKESTGEVREMSQGELLATGEQIYNTRCAACHQVNGQGNEPVFPRLVDNKLVTASDPAEVIDSVYFGRKGTAMQAFGEQIELHEVAAVISYIRNSWGNAAPVVQPSRVASYAASK